MLCEETMRQEILSFMMESTHKAYDQLAFNVLNHIHDMEGFEPGVKLDFIKNITDLFPYLIDMHEPIYACGLQQIELLFEKYFSDDNQEMLNGEF